MDIVRRQPKSNWISDTTKGTTFFTCVSAVLGTGVLAMPVVLSSCNIWMFLFVFTIAMVAQFAVAYATIELLQFSYIDGSGFRPNARPVGAAIGDANVDAGAHGSRNHRTGMSEETEALNTHEHGHAKDYVSTTNARTDSQIQAITKHGGNGTGEGKHVEEEEDEEPGLHSFAQSYLGSLFSKFGFYSTVQIHFVATLVSYGLASPQAFSQLFYMFTGNLDLEDTEAKTSGTLLHTSTAGLFGACFLVTVALAVIFYLHHQQHVLSVFAAIKTCLLVLMVIVVGLFCVLHGKSMSASNTSNGITSALYELTYMPEFGTCDQVFMMSTVAMGGCVNLLPVLFGFILNERLHSGTPHDVTDEVVQNGDTDEAVDHMSRAELARMKNLESMKSTLAEFRNTVFLAITFCFFVNVVWCFAVLYIVSIDELALAYSKGQMSTLPLVHALHKLPHVYILEMTIDVFVAFSVTVSAIVMSTAMRHVLHATAISFIQTKGWMGNLALTLLTHSSVYAFWYGLMVFLVISNPKGFIRFMEIFTGFSINVQSGVYIAWMLYNARQLHRGLLASFAEPKDIEATPKSHLHNNQHHLMLLGQSASYFLILGVGLYFAVASVYDIVFWVFTK